ncbi:Fur family transcriptional regulator [Flavobacterium sp. CAU 1735]|uniref:Fur family transcriptional regulator n=1 Tax=Flavobacterium sp. CAU 1735 TaxID=3140361 RepID=UPI0032602104
MAEKKIKRERSSGTKTAILELLKAQNTALAHKDFHNHFGNTYDRVTIYRALDRLVDEGKLHRITNLDGVVQYALCKECESKEQSEHNHDHVHFSCEKCKKTTCMESIAIRINLPSGYTVREQQILISGICPECNASE